MSRPRDSDASLSRDPDGDTAGNRLDLVLVIRNLANVLPFPLGKGVPSSTTHTVTGAQHSRKEIEKQQFVKSSLCLQQFVHAHNEWNIFRARLGRADASDQNSGILDILTSV